MRKTIADMFREEGYAEGCLNALRRLLLELIRRRFHEPNAEVISVVERCRNSARLHDWFWSAVNARSLKDVGIQDTP